MHDVTPLRVARSNYIEREERRGYISWEREEKVYGKGVYKKGGEEDRGEEENITSWDYERIGATAMIRRLGMG